MRATCSSDSLLRGEHLILVQAGPQCEVSCYAVTVPVRAVVFDVGGVLEVNPATGWPERWGARLGLSGDELAQRIDRLWSGGDIGSVTLAEIERRTRMGWISTMELCLS